MKTVCFREYVDRGLDHVEMADIVERFTRMGLPGAPRGENDQRKGIDYRTAYFSHEKFTKQLEAEQQQAKLSKELMARGLAGLTKATRDRIGRATLTYNLFKRRELVILDTCPDIQKALTSRVRDPDSIEDVLKVEDKGDDCYDGFSYGLFGELGTQPKPQEEKDREKVEAQTDPRAKLMLQYKLTQDLERRRARAEERPPEHLA